MISIGLMTKLLSPQKIFYFFNGIFENNRKSKCAGSGMSPPPIYHTADSSPVLPYSGSHVTHPLYDSTPEQPSELLSSPPASTTPTL